MSPSYLITSFEKSEQPMTTTEIAYYFRNRWTPEDRATALELMRCVDSVLTQANIKYFAYGGTLLSYFRHQKLFDYDDDMDFLLVEPTLPNSLQAYLPKYELGLEKHPTQNVYKIFFRKSSRLTKSPWGFPFIDLAFGYFEGEDFCHDSVYGGVDRFPSTSIFPLKRDLLDGVEISLPHDPRAVCVKKYGTACLTTAVPPNWDHKLARPTGFPQVKVPLEQIEAALQNASHE